MVWLKLNFLNNKKEGKVERGRKRGKGERGEKERIERNERVNDMHGSPGWYLTCRRYHDCTRRQKLRCFLYHWVSCCPGLPRALGTSPGPFPINQVIQGYVPAQELSAGLFCPSYGAGPNSQCLCLTSGSVFWITPRVYPLESSSSPNVEKRETF